MLNALFDFSFSQFVTTKLIRVLYGLALVVAALFALAIGVGIMHDTEGFFGTVAGLAAIPIIFLVSALYSRVVLEPHHRPLPHRGAHADPGLPRLAGSAPRSAPGAVRAGGIRPASPRSRPAALSRSRRAAARRSRASRRRPR